jgi:hypothetical protein
MTKDEDFDLGSLQVRVGKPPDPTVYNLAVDRLACDRTGLLYLLGVVGPQASVKSLRATLNAKVAATFTLEGLHCDDGAGKGGFAQGFRPQEGTKYLVHQHPLGYGQAHALFLSTDPGFLKESSDESLFAALKSPRFTTPLLRSWVGPIAKDLKAQGLLSPLWCFRCRCAVVTAKDEDLDACVTRGVKGGKLLFRELNLVGD